MSNISFMKKLFPLVSKRKNRNWKSTRFGASLKLQEDRDPTYVLAIAMVPLLSPHCVNLEDTGGSSTFATSQPSNLKQTSILKVWLLISGRRPSQTFVIVIIIKTLLLYLAVH